MTQNTGTQATMKLRWLRSGRTALGGNQTSSLKLEAWRLASSLTFSQSKFNGLATATLKARVSMDGSSVALGLLSIGRSPQGVKKGERDEETESVSPNCAQSSNNTHAPGHFQSASQGLACCCLRTSGEACCRAIRAGRASGRRRWAGASAPLFHISCPTSQTSTTL